MKFVRHIIHTLIVLLTVTTAIAQSESDLKKEANKLFEKEQYVDATSNYLRLLSLNPKSGDYNFHYGTCLLFNSYQKKDAIRYLNFAVKQAVVDPRAYYFYGKALHLNYQFDDAIKYYKTYLAKRAKRDTRYQVEREIKMCGNGKKLLTTFTEIIVADKKEIDKSKFYQLYDNMETVGGDILVSADFQSKLDKKKGHIPIVHFPPNAKAIYYSSYGDKGNSGKDIYIRRRLPNGKWGDPQLLPGMVNTLEDEDFPFMHSSGDFLFFSSKGHNSMGGYDVFMSRFDPNTNSFKKPENVDFAISSPDDDLFYIVDETFQNAYFASSRQSQNGKLHVYNVRVARVPIREIIVMGTFLSEINPENKAMTVSVTNYSNGEKIGLIKSNKAGKYSFVFPQGGKYTYEVKIDGSEDVYKFMVELPFLDEFRPLKQQALHASIDGQENVRIINLFDERVEGAEALIAEVIRKKATLDVNVNSFDLDQLDATTKRNKILTDLGFNDMSLREVSNQLEELSITEKLKQEKVELINSNINAEIVEKREQIKNFDNEIIAIKKNIEPFSSSAQIHGLLNETLRIESEKIELATEINNLAILKNKAKATLTSSNGNGQILELENQFNSLISEGKEEEALLLLSKSKNAILKTKNESPDAIVNNLIEESVSLSKDVKELKDQELVYEKSMDQLSSKIIMLNNSLPEAKKKEYLKIKSEIASKEEELALVKEILVISQKSIDEKNKELNVLDNNIASMQKAMLSEEIIVTNPTLVVESMNEIEDILRNDQREKIMSEILAIEESHPGISSTNDSDSDSLFLISQVESIENRNQEKAGEIESNSNLSEIERDEQLIANNSTTLDEIEKRLVVVRQELNKKPTNSSLKEELTDLNDLKDEIILENNELENTIAQNKNAIESTEVAISQEDVLDEVVTNYSEDVASIKSNSDYSEKEKLQQLQSIDEKAIANIFKEQSRLKKELKKDPDNQELIARNDMLNGILEEKQADINERSQTLNAIENISSIVDNTVIKKQLEDKIKGDLDLESAQIKNGNDSEFEKNKQLLELNQLYLKKIKLEEQSLNKATKNDTEDTTLKQQLSVLQTMKTDQQNKLTHIKEVALSSISAGELVTVVSSVDGKYKSDVEKINSAEPSFRYSDLASRENELQDRLDAKLVQLKKILAKNYLETADLDRAIFERVIKESEMREATAIEANKSLLAKNTDTKNVNENTISQDDFIARLRTATSNTVEKELTANYSTKKELVEQDLTLVTYEQVLNDLIKRKKSEISSDSENQSLKEELPWLENELQVVQQKLQQISMSIGELEQEAFANNTQTKESYVEELRAELIGNNASALNENHSTKEELFKQDKILENYENQLVDEVKLMKIEIKKDEFNKKLKNNFNWLEDELEIVQKKRRQISVTFGELETDIIADNSSKNTTPEERIVKSQEDNANLIAQLNNISNETNDPVIQEIKQLSESKSEDIKRLIDESNKAKSEVEKEYLLAKAQNEQDAMNTIIVTTVTDKQRESIEEREGINLLTQDELKKRKRRFSIQIGDLTTEILSIEEEIKVEKRKEIPKLETRKSQLIAQRSILEKQLSRVEEQLLNEDQIVSVVSEQAANTSMTFNEERKQAGTEAYKKYYELGTDALQTERAIVALEKELQQEKIKVNQLINENSSAKKEEINSSIERVKTLTFDITRLKTELTQKKYLADKALPINSTETMRIQNLVYRGVKPLKTVAIATLLQMPVNGFAINETALSSYSKANPIPVDVESPSGLIYRVQIGAFAKPIPQNLYKEFTPVSGEKIDGTNITRYMAGYFNNSSAVVDARRSIRALGYSDAFIVAYCDGKRIGFGDARRREANGTCVPKGTNELMVEVATKTAENLGLPVSQEVQEVPELTYNQAPGASYADPIEMMQGLFFTVQIGVYNRPISDAVVYNLPELSTVRLPNGQIRYNTGLFNSVSEALPRRKDALKRGIVGAFVVAYFKGERIPLAKAKLLLSEKGQSILQSNLPKVLSDEPTANENTVIVERTDSVSIDNITDLKEEAIAVTDRIQIVTKKTFTEFPRDVLNRYNAEGSFFYDAKDQKVKSVIYEHEDDLPRLWNFVDDIDTIYIPLSEMKQFNREIISVDIEEPTIQGDVMDWLLRFSYPREITETKTGIKIKIFDVEKEDVEKVMEQIRIFELNPVIEELELEIEEYE